MNERGVVPNFHLRVSLSLVYFLGTWPPRTTKYRFLYLLYTVFSFTFILGVMLATEIANMIISWGDMSKIVAGATLLMTNCTHASKVSLRVHKVHFKKTRLFILKILSILCLIYYVFTKYI